MIRNSKIAVALALAALAMVAVAPSAVASPAKQGYDETTVLGNVDQGGPAASETIPAGDSGGTAPVAVESTSASSLPFTGADIGILVALGILLAGTGLILRRVVRQQRPTS